MTRGEKRLGGQATGGKRIGFCGGSTFVLLVKAFTGLGGVQEGE